MRPSAAWARPKRSAGWLATATLTSAALLALSPSARAYCPCYTASSAYNDHNCAQEAVAGTNPTEAEWLDIFDLVSRGPEAWGDDGPDVDDIGQGCGQPEPMHDVPARFPCELIMAITRAETSWKQFCVPDRPDDQVGPPERTIISFDCGYGVGQVTSGMRTTDPAPSFDRERVAGEAIYNAATGTRILASKWRYTQCVGDNQPMTIEHWYTATWAYNGLAYVNNPNNPSYDSNRGVWNPDIGGSAPYQEKVFGRMEYTQGRWPPTELAYPNPGDIGGGNSPPQLPEPSCASPTNCSSSRPTHQTYCTGEAGFGGAAGAGGSSASAGSGPTGGSAGNGTGTGTAQGGSAGPSDAELGGIAGDDEGCSCRSAGAPNPSTGAAACWAGVGLLLLALRRRHRPRPEPSMRHGRGSHR